MAVIIGAITPRDTEVDNATLELANPLGVHGVTVEGSTYVYVAGFGDSGISGFLLGSNGSLTSIQNIPDDATLELLNASHITSATVGGSTYLYANAYGDDGISVFQVNANGTLTTGVQNITDNAALELDGSWGRSSVAQVGSTSFLIASGQIDDGISVFQINPNNGTLANTDNETDGGLLELDGATDTAAVTVGNRTFVYVAGSTDDGISAFELSASGTLSSVQNLADDATLNLNGAWGLATASVDGTPYLIASGLEDAGLSVFSVNGSGQLINTDNVEDTSARGLNFPTDLKTFTLDGEAFVVSSSIGDNALTVFHLGVDGKLADVTTIFDSVATALSYSLGNGFAVAGGAPFLLGTGFLDSGFTAFDIGSGNDTLTGTGAADVLLGLLGNDLLDGAGGEDRLIGGGGNDTYLVNSAGDEVVERTGGGTDTVRTARSYTLDANVENLVLLGGAALDGTGNRLNNQITGNSGANDLTGANGNDRLAGGGKADTLLGGRGRDIMEGQGGADDFVYTNVNQSGITNGTRDQILGFKGRDDIVLTRIDAVKGEPGNQNFTFDTNGDFAAGEIRFREIGAGVLVELNVDRDARAELSILLKNFTGTLANNDFEV